MIGTAGAAVAGTLAAPVIGGVAATGLAIGAPSAIYAGQTWNEMEGEKNAAVALTAGLVQGSLDRLGIGALTGVAPKNITKEAIKKIMATGASREIAEATLANATKAELAGFLKDTTKFATAKLAAKEGTQALLKSAASEGLTEVMQEATAYVAATQGSDKEFEWEELSERLRAAAIAGSALGGAFSVPGSVQSVASRRALIGDNALADESTASQSAVYAQQEVDTRGHVATNAENLATLHSEIAAEAPGLTLAERAADFRRSQRGRTGEEKVRDAFNAIPSLWRGATRNIFTDDLLRQSRSARIAADLFGGNPDRVFSGASFEDAKHHRVAQYKNLIPIPDQIFHVMNEGKAFSRNDKTRISNQIYSELQAAVDKDGKFDPNAVTDSKFKQTIVKMGQDLNALSDKMYNDQKKHNPELGYIKNYLFKYKTLNKPAVHRNRAKFEKALRDTL